jgi:hypothetical protein
MIAYSIVVVTNTNLQTLVYQKFEVKGFSYEFGPTDEACSVSRRRSYPSSRARFANEFWDVFRYISRQHMVKINAIGRFRLGPVF